MKHNGLFILFVPRFGFLSAFLLLGKCYRYSCSSRKERGKGFWVSSFRGM